MIPHLINNSLVMTNRHMFLFTNPARPNIYTLSLHDALPIYQLAPEEDVAEHQVVQADGDRLELGVVKEDEGIEELVPGEREREERRRQDAGRREREDHAPERAEARRTVHHRRLLQVARNRPEEAH